MKRNAFFIYCFCWFFLPMTGFSQIPNQTIRGQVMDEISGAPIPGVSIILEGSDPLKGTTTDENGTFQMNNVAVGRQTLRFSYIGYETQWVRDIMVSSSREVILTIMLRESVTEMDALIVEPDPVKSEPINPMAFNSSRRLSMEEASRYAGGFDDPARLTSSFAGVTGNLSDNAIVIRGNAPKGMLWQMEGVAIPTPSHFANVVTIGGGGITALSSHMLGDSDFYTGAFPAEYGNALSGVFDLNIRNGNNQNYEHAFEIGTIGIDVASEGPLGEEGASYLFNYRISTFSLIAPLLPEDAEDILYQNFSYKINLPTRSKGTFTLWGIGANDRSGSVAETSPASWTYNQDREDTESPTRFGVVAISHRILMGDQAYLRTNLAASGNGFELETDRFTDDASKLYPLEYIRNETGKLTAKSMISIKLDSHHSNRSGVVVNRLGYNQWIRQSVNQHSPLETLVEETGHSYQIQFFSQSKVAFETLDITGGIHTHYFYLTDAVSVEPRMGMQFQAGSNSFSISYGRHSQIEPLSFYFVQPENRNLDLAKADHFVAGYSHLLDQNVHLNIEAYYQRLFDIPVVPNSSYSVLNLDNDWFFYSMLVNKGAGRNYGIEMTLERYLSKGWYGLLTGTLFKSEYRGGDEGWRNTRFDRGYSLVLLGGKEWELTGEKKVRILSLNGRINLTGGKRYSPVDIQKSRQEREVLYNETRAFSEQEPDIFYADISVEYRINSTNRSSVWSLHLINMTGHKEFYGYRYNLRDNSIDAEKELILIPDISYKIEF